MKSRRCILTLVIVLLIQMLCLLPVTGIGETKVTLNDTVKYYKGTSTISWSVSGSEASSYNVHIEAINNGSAKQTTFSIGSTTRHSIQSTEMVPGHSYTVYVTDDNDLILDSHEYVIPKSGTFEDGLLKNTSVQITREYRKKDKNGKYIKINNLSAQEIMNALAEGKELYGMKYTMKMPTLIKERTFLITLVFESPDGYICVEEARTYTFDRMPYGSEIVWFELAGDTFFHNLYKTTGDIPVGKYTVTLYWDGSWVNTTYFDVR